MQYDLRLPDDRSRGSGDRPARSSRGLAWADELLVGATQRGGNRGRRGRVDADAGMFYTSARRAPPEERHRTLREWMAERGGRLGCRAYGRALAARYAIASLVHPC